MFKAAQRLSKKKPSQPTTQVEEEPVAEAEPSKTDVQMTESPTPEPVAGKKRPLEEITPPIV